ASFIRFAHQSLRSCHTRLRLAFTSATFVAPQERTYSVAEGGAKRNPRRGELLPSYSTPRPRLRTSCVRCRRPVYSSKLSSPTTRLAIHGPPRAALAVSRRRPRRRLHAVRHRARVPEARRARRGAGFFREATARSAGLHRNLLPPGQALRAPRTQRRRHRHVPARHPGCSTAAQP